MILEIFEAGTDTFGRQDRSDESECSVELFRGGFWRETKLGINTIEILGSFQLGIHTDDIHDRTKHGRCQEDHPGRPSLLGHRLPAASNRRLGKVGVAGDRTVVKMGRVPRENSGGRDGRRQPSQVHRGIRAPDDCCWGWPKMAQPAEDSRASGHREEKTDAG